MPEGLSPSEAGKGLAEHRKHAAAVTERMGLIGAGGLLLTFAVIQLLGLPGPPG